MTFKIFNLFKRKPIIKAKYKSPVLNKGTVEITPARANDVHKITFLKKGRKSEYYVKNLHGYTPVMEKKLFEKLLHAGLNVEDTHKLGENQISKSLGKIVWNYSFKNADERKRFLRNLGILVGKMHNLDVSHGHLHSKNITWDGKRAGIIDSKLAEPHSVDWEPTNKDVSRICGSRAINDYKRIMFHHIERDIGENIPLTQKEKNQLIKRVVNQYSRLSKQEKVNLIEELKTTLK